MLPLGLRFTNAQKAKGNRRSARRRAKSKSTNAYRAHALDRAGLDHARAPRYTSQPPRQFAIC